ncbi:plasmid recombination protein [Maritimibacter alkaliphilus]|uniref:plasmid recombination protein n=1 Tax=Maritimibacter alkaliphilus TaxID=404236 RepID=UPI001C9456D3|nr:plasmid recombination protein [Maritimibacter alkaliphilus]MBY6091768.1 plasmid recombination protein [Maritimibacter alkaliphilus]
MASPPQQNEKYRVVLRMRGMFPNDLAGYEAHRLRKGGDISHVDRGRSHLNKTFIGKDTWAAEALEWIQEIRLQNFLDEVTALRKRKRKKDAERRLAEGPKDPWRATRHGPLREIILTANSAYFDDEMAEFFGENREAEFQACAENWLRKEFKGDIIHARVDRDETAFHVHAVLLPIERVEMTRTNKKTGETKVIAVRHMLQPSKHDLIKDYEQAQDSAGAAFSVVNLQRGERRAAAIRHARAAGQPLPKRRYYARTSEWRAEQELKLEAQKAELNEREEALDRRDGRLDTRDAALAVREAEIDSIHAAIEGVESGALTFDASGDVPRLEATAPEEKLAPETARLMQRLMASPKGAKRATTLVGRLFGALKRRTRADAEQAMSRDIAEIRKARDMLQGFVSRLSGKVATSGKTTLKGLARSLMALRRHETPDHGEEYPPDRD